jgi:iron complex transport system permease protein
VRQARRHHSGQAAPWLALALLALAALLVLLGAGVGSTGFESVLNARQDPLPGRS